MNHYKQNNFAYSTGDLNHYFSMLSLFDDGLCFFVVVFDETKHIHINISYILEQQEMFPLTLLPFEMIIIYYF